jgi:hypothetical protein
MCRQMSGQLEAPFITVRRQRIVNRFADADLSRRL